MTVDTYTLTAESPWTVPTGVTSVQIEIWGAGASGGGWNVSACGGGAGGYSKLNALSVTPGNTVTFTIGVGGAPQGTSGFGQAGTASTSSGMTANGGAGGSTTGGAGGTASGGDVNTSGGNGVTWVSGTNGKAGGNSPNGGTGGGDTGGAGNAGNPPGGGGSGTGTIGGNTGAGGRGEIRFTYTAGAGLDLATVTAAIYQTGVGGMIGRIYV